MNLNWDIDYEFSFNTFYPVNLQILFKIPIKDDRQVYMKHFLDINAQGFIIIIDTKKFIRTWRKSRNDPRIPNYHIGNEELWRADYKFHYPEESFQLGKENPVPIATEIHCVGQYPNCNISFSDGITRTIWLLANEAEYFPIVARDINSATSFQLNAGRDNCSIYPCEGLTEQWLKENESLLPKTPKEYL